MSSGLPSRLLDASRESLGFLTPLSGLFKYITPIPIAESVQNLPLDGIEVFVQRASQFAEHYISLHPECELTADEIASIRLYTDEWPSASSDSLYHKLNSLLRDENREGLKPWRPFLLLLLQGLAKLECHPCTVYRGCQNFPAALLDRYRHARSTQNPIEWYGFSSATITVDVTRTFLGDAPNRILFMIDGRRCKDISPFSSVRSENELLLPVNTKLRVVSILEDSGGLTCIQLREIPPDDPILPGLAIPPTPTPAAIPTPPQVPARPAVDATPPVTESLAPNSAADADLNVPLSPCYAASHDSTLTQIETHSQATLVCTPQHIGFCDSPEPDYSNTPSAQLSDTNPNHDNFSFSPILGGDDPSVPQFVQFIPLESSTESMPCFGTDGIMSLQFVSLGKRTSSMPVNFDQQPFKRPRRFPR